MPKLDGISVHMMEKLSYSILSTKERTKPAHIDEDNPVDAPTFFFICIAEDYAPHKVHSSPLDINDKVAQICLHFSLIPILRNEST